MFKLFRKKKLQENTPHPTADKAASVIIKSYVKMQTAWAVWLSKKEGRMTLPQKKRALAVFCVVMIVLPCSILYKGVIKKEKSSADWLKTPSVTLPEDTRLPDSLNLDYLRELDKKRQSERLQFDSIQH